MLKVNKEIRVTKDLVVITHQRVHKGQSVQKVQPALLVKMPY